MIRVPGSLSVQIIIIIKISLFALMKIRAHGLNNFLNGVIPNIIVYIIITLYLIISSRKLITISITNYFKAKKKTLGEKDDSIAKEQLQQEEELRKAESLYFEASSRLQNAIKKKTNEMSVFQGLMEVASKKIESARRKFEDCRKDQIAIGSKRKRVLENYSSTLEKLVKITQ